MNAGTFFTVFATMPGRSKTPVFALLILPGVIIRFWNNLEPSGFPAISLDRSVTAIVVTVSLGAFFAPLALFVVSPYTLHPATYTLHPTPYTLHSTPYILHPTTYTLHPTPYTLYPALYTQPPTPYTPHPTPYTLHPTPYTLFPTSSTVHHKP